MNCWKAGGTFTTPKHYDIEFPQSVWHDKGCEPLVPFADADFVITQLHVEHRFESHLEPMTLSSWGSRYEA
jgi:hypothetical protein